MKRILLTAFTLAFAGVLAYGVAPVSAGVSITLRPVKFVLDLQPGALYTDSVIITNNGESPLTLQPSLESFVPTGEANISFVKNAGNGSSLADWVKVTESNIILQPKEERRIPFTITVPSNAAPGGHFAVIFFNAADGASASGTTGVGILPRVGSLIMVAVPGDIAKGGRIASFTGPKYVERGPLGFNVVFENTGSVHYQPEGTVKVTNIFGHTVGTGILDGLFVFPKTSRTMKALVAGDRYYWGPLKVTVSATDGTGQAHQASLRLWAWPWRITLIPLVGLVLVIFAFIQFRRRFKFQVRRRE
jgi:hypothetical protein